VWAAVRGDNGDIVCHVEDYDATNVPEQTKEFRWWKMVTWSPDNLKVLIWQQAEDCTVDDPCAPGDPCPACTKEAKSYWDVWDIRSGQRFWMASKEPDDFEGYDGDHWCGHRHTKRETAMACAAKGGFHKAVRLDGHWNRLETVRTD
jgi:hypothetical protein